MSLMLRAIALIVAAVAVAGCGNTHPLQEGDYAFTRGEVVRDDCGEAARPELVSGGTLHRHGHEVRFDSGFFDVKLVGQFLSLTERFRVDGSTANVVTTVAGRACVLDLVVLSMEAETIDPTSFAGTLSAQYQAQRPVDCDCETWVRFTAARR